MESSERDDDEDLESKSREVCANGRSMDASQVESKLDEGNIKEAESSLREGLSLNFEVYFFYICLLAYSFVICSLHLIQIDLILSF